MKLFDSLLFRLTLLHTLIFSLLLGSLLALYFFVNVHLPTDAVKSGIRGEFEAIEQDGHSPEKIAAAIAARDLRNVRRSAVHALIRPDGRTVTSNLPRLPAGGRDGWLRVETDASATGENNYHIALALDQRLPDGSRLIIGRDIEDLEQRKAVILEVARWLFIGGTLFGLLSGIVMSRLIGQRIDTIATTARRVMGGNLSQRIPIYGREDDFGHLAETLNLMLDRIQSLLTTLRRVSDSVAHELRTPLTRLHTDLSELAISVPEDKRGLAEEAVVETENLIALFDAVIRIGRIESGRGAFELARLNLSEILADVAETFTPAAEEKDLKLSVAIDENLPVMGNRNLLFQAIGNVVDNAIKYATAGGTVKLIGVSRSTEIDIFVVDNGSGIPAHQRDVVFERFVRLTETSDAPGLGLGLSFVKAVADTHRSTLVLEDASPGLRFRWVLPSAM